MNFSNTVDGGFKMNKRYTWLTPILIMVSLAVAGNAFATNGYFTHGIGAKNKAMAGAGIALPEDAIDVTNNPAVAPFVGDQLVLGAAIFSPIRKYETSESLLNGNFGAFTIGPNKIKSDSNYFIVPHIAKSWQLDNGNAWAISFYGRGGMNTDWSGGTATWDPTGMGLEPVTRDGTFGAGTTGVNFSQAFLDVTWGKQFNENFSLGVSAVLVAQWFKAEGVNSFWPYTKTFADSWAAGAPIFEPQNLSNNGTDYAFGGGLKLGLHWMPTERVALGVMYQTEIKMSEFDKYADLFADAGDMDIPADLKVGLTFHANQDVALSFDIEHTWYSDIGSVGNPIQNLFACPTAMMGGMDFESCLGGRNGGGFGWDDMTTYKLGMRWIAGEDWTWRFGYSFGEQPIGEDQMTFNILAPGVMESHITAGFTLERTKGRQFNMAFMYAPNVDQTGPQNFDPTQTVTFEMYQWEVEASYSWQF
jgi:long-chain fatty acid transport protein